jgi:hypothetical protein
VAAAPTSRTNWRRESLMTVPLLVIASTRRLVPFIVRAAKIPHVVMRE